MGRILRRLAYGCGPSGDQRYFVRILLRRPSAPKVSASEGINNPAEHALHPRHAGKYVCAIGAVLDRVEAVTTPYHAAPPIHPYPATHRRPLKLRDPCRARCIVVRYRGGGAPADCEGRSLSRRARVSALSSQQRSRGMSVSAPLAWPRPPSRRWSEESDGPQLPQVRGRSSSQKLIPLLFLDRSTTTNNYFCLIFSFAVYTCIKLSIPK